MKELFKKDNLKQTCFTMLYLVFGVMFCTLLGTMYDFVESALCFALLVFGVIFLCIYALLPGDDKIPKLLFYGIFGMVFGILILLYRKFFGIVLSVIVGYNGVILIISAIKDKKKKEAAWITSFVIGIIVVVLAVVAMILSGTNAGKIILSIFFGVILLLNGIFNLVTLIVKINKEKEQKKIQVGENNSSEVDDNKTDKDAVGTEKEEKIENSKYHQISENSQNLNVDEVSNEKYKDKSKNNKK